MILPLAVRNAEEISSSNLKTPVPNLSSLRQMLPTKMYLPLPFPLSRKFLNII